MAVKNGVGKGVRYEAGVMGKCGLVIKHSFGRGVLFLIRRGIILKAQNHMRGDCVNRAREDLQGDSPGVV